MLESKMTKTRAKQWLPAVRELLRCYQGEEYMSTRCPLCRESLKLFCQDCIWVLFSGETCACHADEIYGDGPASLRMFRNQPWTRNSIKRLKGWEARLLKIIGRK